MCDGPRKTANDESLARDEGGGSIPRFREATYKTVQGCLAHDTGDGNQVFRELSPADQDRRLRPPKGVWCYAIQVLATTMKIPYRATSSAPKGDRQILEYTTKWSSPN